MKVFPLEKKFSSCHMALCEASEEKEEVEEEEEEFKGSVAREKKKRQKPFKISNPCRTSAGVMEAVSLELSYRSF